MRGPTARPAIHHAGQPFRAIFSLWGRNKLCPYFVTRPACCPLVTICTVIKVFTLVAIAVFTCYRYHPMITTLCRVPRATEVLLESVALVDYETPNLKLAP